MVVSRLIINSCSPRLWTTVVLWNLTCTNDNNIYEIVQSVYFYVEWLKKKNSNIKTVRGVKEIWIQNVLFRVFYMFCLLDRVLARFGRFEWKQICYRAMLCFMIFRVKPNNVERLRDVIRDVVHRREPFGPNAHHFLRLRERIRGICVDRETKIRLLKQYNGMNKCIIFRTDCLRNFMLQ